MPTINNMTQIIKTKKNKRKIDMLGATRGIVLI